MEPIDWTKTTPQEVIRAAIERIEEIQRGAGSHYRYPLAVLRLNDGLDALAIDSEEITLTPAE